MAPATPSPATAADHAPLGPETERGSTGRSDYRIQARVERVAHDDPEAPAGVDPKDGFERFTLNGRLELDYLNSSADSLDELWFHAYLNAFSNDRSTHLVAADGMLRGRRMEAGWGWMQIESVGLLGPGGSTADLTDNLSWEAPSIANEDDRTVFKVELAEPLPPGERITVAIEWTSLLPRVQRRTGTKGNFMLVAQWFPKLGVYESGRGWNAHPFHAFTEFYADYGTYDVELNLPSDFAGRVFASGKRVNEIESDERIEVSFRAPSDGDREYVDPFGKTPLVHDFTWTADPDYTTETFRFSFAEWAEEFPDEVARAREAFGDDVDLNLRDVDVEVLVQPEHSVQAERHYRATAATLFFYGLWFGEYPFERITVVDPAWGASAAGGMEYPTLFTAGTRMFTDEWMHTPEGVTIHECGHQWFYHLVGNNEFEAAWLDEGFNSYADGEVAWRVYGPSESYERYSSLPVRGTMLAGYGSGVSGRLFTARELRLPRLEWLGIEKRLSVRPLRTSGFLDGWREQPLLTLAPERTDPRWNDRRRYLGSPDRDPLDTWAWNALDRNSHYTNSYARTATVLRSMPIFLSASSPDGTDGEAAFMRGMREYATLWRFRHPYPQDFFETFEAGDGVDVELDEFFEELFRGTGTIDWSLSVTQERERDPKGVFMSAAGDFEELEADDDEEQPDEVEAVAGGDVPATAESELAAVEEPGPSAADGDAGDGDADGGDELGDDVADSDETKAEDEPWSIDLVVEARGALALPVPVRLTFEDGHVEEFVWTREEQLEKRWLRRTFEHPTRLVSAEVDPDRGYFLETDRSNNGWYEQKSSYGPERWAERIFTQLAHRLHFQKGLGG